MNFVNTFKLSLLRSIYLWTQLLLLLLKDNPTVNENGAAAPFQPMYSWKMPQVIPGYLSFLELLLNTLKNVNAHFLGVIYFN